MTDFKEDSVIATSNDSPTPNLQEGNPHAVITTDYKVTELTQGGLFRGMHKRMTIGATLLILLFVLFTGLSGSADTVFLRPVSGLKRPSAAITWLPSWRCLQSALF